MEWCKNCDKGLPKPDVVIFLEIKENEVLERGEYGKELYEREEFQKVVREKYELLREQNWKMVNANDSIENIHKNIVEIIQNTRKEEIDEIKKLWM